MKKPLYLIALSFVIIAQSCGTTQEDKSLILVTSPAGDNSEEPNLIHGADGNLYLSWIERNEKSATLKYAKWQNDEWSAPEIIAHGNDWFVNWADYPAMAVNKSGDMIAHYLQMSDSGTYTYDIKVIAKKTLDTKWSHPIKLHSDTVNAEHGFVSMLPLEDDTFFLTWLDGRNTASEDAHHGHGGGGAMTIRSAILSVDLEIIQENELDNRVCDCCQTSAAITSNGPIVVYRDRSEEEIRDMSIVRFENEVWSSPKSVNNDQWNISGCPVNGPKAVAIDNQLAVAWFTAAEGVPQVKLSFSNNAGVTFNDVIRLDQGNPIGRVDIEMMNSETAIVSWLEGENIVAAKVNIDGSILERYMIAASSTSRSSGFPQLALINDKLLVAWTDSNVKKIKMGILEL